MCSLIDNNNPSYKDFYYKEIEQIKPSIRNQADYQLLLVNLWMKKNVSQEQCYHIVRVSGHPDTVEALLDLANIDQKTHVCHYCVDKHNHKKCPGYFFIFSPCLEPFYLTFLSTSHYKDMFSLIDNCQCVCHSTFLPGDKK